MRQGDIVTRAEGIGMVKLKIPDDFDILKRLRLNDVVRFLNEHNKPLTIENIRTECKFVNNLVYEKLVELNPNLFVKKDEGGEDE